MSINSKSAETNVYKMGNMDLKQVKNEKDIGVIIDNQLKFEDHMNKKIKKANSMIGLIRRCFVLLDETMFLKLYKSLVRHHIEYANTIWYPSKKKDITAIENVQCQATKFLPTLKNLEYEDRLHRVMLLILHYRGRRGDMTETYKMMSGKYDTTLTTFLLKANESITSLPPKGHSLKLYVQRAEKSHQCNYFSLWVTNQWNRLPA